MSSYAFEALPEGITVVPDTGKLSIDTTNSIPKQQYQVVVTVKSQTITSPKFSMEVFDCSGVFTFMTTQKIQVDDRTEKAKQVISVITENTNKE